MTIDYHRELLGDELRTEMFRRAIARAVRPGDVVLDLGCGSGILSFFACQAGAARVYAVDHSPAADVAAFLARHLRFDDRVTVLRNEASAVELPERADVLLTETMGVLGFDEGIAGLVRDARARLLKPDARIVPCRLGVSLVPVELESEYAHHIEFWRAARYGLDLTPLRVFASNAILFAHIHPRAYLAEPAEMFTVDLTRAETAEARGEATFTATRGGTMHGLAGFFTAVLGDGLELSNRVPRATSWSQALLPLETPVALRAGDRVVVELQTNDGKSWRWRGNAAGEAFDQTTWLAVPPRGS